MVAFILRYSLLEEKKSATPLQLTVSILTPKEIRERERELAKRHWKVVGSENEGNRISVIRRKTNSVFHFTENRVKA